ncbi:MAG: hypothetical protein KTR17_05910 [Cellvibrionaceae bacterium]|nr:hypothetical protein [Cellvibrionaceae bacterium]
MDPLSASLLTFGIILLVASWVILLIDSFKQDYSWGLTTLFVPPLSYIYALFTWQKSKDPLIFAGIGWLLVLLSL